MDKNFSMTFNVGYDQADALIQIEQLCDRKEQLSEAVSDKKAGKAYDMLLLRPVFFPPIKKAKPGFDTEQVDKVIAALKDDIKALELQLLG